jgi:siroheme synthase (precorrin-2 oxidase/ferrochelatase)
VSTGGAAPALAAHLRRRLDRELAPSLGDAASVLAAAREQMHRSGRSTLVVDWEAVVSEVIALVDGGDLAGARAAAAGAVESAR